MLKNSQTKVIAPVVTLGLLTEHLATGEAQFSDKKIQTCYESAVKQMKAYLGHDVHIGAKYYDAYGSRMSRYGVLEQIGHLQYHLLPPYADEAAELCAWIPAQIKSFIDKKLGIVPLLSDSATRLKLSDSKEDFDALISEQIAKGPTNFEIFTFAVMKVHLEKFACKIYRDTRTSAHDRGVDISTNFGVVYQIKKLRIHTEAQAAELYSELRSNFDRERLQDGSVILVIDDMSSHVKQYLIDMKVQSISKADVVKLAANFDEPEDRQKVLRIISDEFRREYSSRIS